MTKKSTAHNETPQEKLTDFFDDRLGIKSGNIFFDYKDENYLINYIKNYIVSFEYELKERGILLGENINPPEFLDTMNKWIAEFKTQEITGFVPDKHEAKVIQWIDDKFGTAGGYIFADYDSGNKLMQYVQEEVGMDEDLTLMCGVGTLKPAITHWIQNFKNETQHLEPPIDVPITVPVKKIKKSI